MSDAVLSHKTAMICYRYAFGVSPTLINICSYLFDKQGIKVDVYLDRMHRGSQSDFEDMRIIDVESLDLVKKILGRFAGQHRRKFFVSYVAPRLKKYHRVFAADFNALVLLDEMGYDLSKVVYISLESTDYIKLYPLDYARRLLAKCSLCTIQSPERASDLVKYLEVPLSFTYLPVSVRPIIAKPKRTTGKLRLIYSGYFAEWACLIECIESYKKSVLYEVATLRLHGHFMGTEQYVVQLKQIIEGAEGISLDTSYYANDNYVSMLSEYDVGLVFYNNIDSSPNFENMTLSSGKIANYLWNSMAVITNIDSSETREQPFGYVDPTDFCGFRSAVERIINNRKLYSQAAFERAQTGYDFDTYMGVVYEKLAQNSGNNS